MLLSENGKNAIKAFEGLYLTAYRCPAGVLTIGWGCTEGVYEGMMITLDQAEQMLDRELAKFVKAVNDLVDVPLSQNQFDALVSFSYNVGIAALQRSTLLRKLNAGDYAAVPAELARWNKGGGKVLSGLVKRRSAEAALWRKAGAPVTPIKDPMAQKVDAPLIGEFAMPQFLLGLITTILGQVATADAQQPEQKPSAGVTVPQTVTNTNFIQGILGAVLAAIGVQSFGADALHTIGAIGGVVIALSAFLNQTHIINVSNANTLAVIGQLLAQVGAQAQKDKEAIPGDPNRG